MSKVRVVMAEMEGTDAAVQDAIRSFAHCVVARLERPATAAEPIAPPAEEPRALPAPKAGPRRTGKLKHAPPATAAPAVGERGSLSAAIRAAVADGPKTNGDVLRWVQAHGFPAVDSSTVSTILCQRRKANEMYKDDGDLTWRMADAVERVRARA